jgi:hypothetical protein
MNNKHPKVIGISVAHPTSRFEAEAVEGGKEGALQLSIEIENPNDDPIHVWASRRSYEYDAATHVLTLHLAETAENLPPGIQIISQHPRTPVQVAVNGKSRVRIKVPVPAVFRRRVPSRGLGMSFVEEPIRQIDRVVVHMQHANEPIKSRVGESPSEFRQRLKAHGDVVRAEIVPTADQK